MGSCHPSFALVKFWQGIVETLLRILCIVLTMICFTVAIVNVVALGSRRTEIPSIEALRFQTRSPSGWIMLVTIIVLPLDSLIVLVRFLNLSMVINHIKIFLGIDVIIKVVIALMYFGGGIALGVHSNDWSYWLGRASAEDEVYNIPAILASTSAVAAFTLLTPMAYICLAVWLVLFIVFNWDSNMTRYSPKFAVKVSRVGNPEASIVIEEKPSQELTQQLKF